MRNLLREGIKRLSDKNNRRAKGNRNAAVVAVAAQKGGVGKTTTAVNLGAALARFHGQNVLVVDLDAQGHVQRSLRTHIKPGGGSLSQVIEREDGGEVLDVVAHTDIPGLHITPGDPRLRESENLVTTRIGKEFILRDALEVTRSHYDVIILDCPPNLGNLTLNALVAADRVLVPCEPTPLSIQGVDALIRTCATVSDRLNPKLDILGILVTRYDGRNTSLNDVAIAELSQAYGEALIDEKININTSLARAQHAGRDIFSFAPRSRGATNYKSLAEHVATALRSARRTA